MSGKINLTDSEKGTRGSWWEKRRAFIGALTQRGHQVEIVESDDPNNYAVLFLEFGSRNALFHEGTLLATQEIVKRPHGWIIYLCDDPDLPYDWESISNKHRWAIWANCLDPAQFSDKSGIEAFDFPFSALQECRTPAMKYQKELVYIGRPCNRRVPLFEALDLPINLQVYAKEKDWKGWTTKVNEPPTQVERSDFYNSKMGCLGIADKKHHKLGWRTGRIFHAIMAGCPAVAESEHLQLANYPLLTYRHPSELFFVFSRLKDPEYRLWAVNEQQEAVKLDRNICETRFMEIGM